MEAGHDPVYGFIYKITNTKNGKIYVGQHRGVVFGEYWGSGLLLKKAYAKHGKENFKREILEFATTKQELNKLECKYIDKLGAIGPNGYNIATGGAGGFIVEATEEIREKISRGLKGKPKSETHKRNISQAKKGISHKQTDETKKKIAESRKGIEPWNKGHGTPVKQLTINGEYIKTWPSLHEAAKSGFNVSKISECLRGTRKSHKNFIWRLDNG